MKRFFCALILGATILVGQAQTMIEANLTGQPLSYQKNGVVTGCGMRIFAFVQTPGSQMGRVLDASFNFWDGGQSLVKAIFSEYDAQALQRGQKMRALPISRVWLKASGSKATDPLNGKVSPGEDEHSIIYATSLDSVLDLFLTVLDKQPISIGLQQKTDKQERIYFGTVALTDSEARQVRLCLDEALKLAK